jgi:hypothetical protein
MKQHINEICRMQQLAGLIKENQSTLEQDIDDFWGALQDDAAQSNDEYEAEWDTEFFIEQYPQYEGMEDQINSIVTSFDIR